MVIELTAAELKEEKKALRRQIRAAYPGPEERDRESKALCRVLREHLMAHPPRCVAGYMAMPREADITPLLRELQRDGVRLALPCVDPAGDMIFREMPEPERMVPDAFGIPAPPADARLIDPAEIDVMLIPLEAADRDGHRLGKGGGFYDRCLPVTGAYRVGIALRHQLTERIPTEPHDCILHACATADGMLIFRQDRIEEGPNGYEAKTCPDAL